MRRICVFCGSLVGNDASYLRVARDCGTAIAQAGYGIVYGGGRIGLMGAMADAALAAGADVTGVIPRALARREVAHDGLTELRVVETMHERKAVMADLSDAVIALPGGFGTMDELCEMLSWRQLGLHGKPVGLLNHRGYYDGLIALFDTMLREGFITPHERALVASAESIDALLLGNH